MLEDNESAMTTSSIAVKMLHIEYLKNALGIDGLWYINRLLEDTILNSGSFLAFSAALMERWYCTLRQSCARFVRKTLSFSKSDVMHEIVTRLFIIRYNLSFVI
jgi:hypothetical protein